MRVGKDKLRRRRRFFTILILFSFIISALPGGMKNIRAEELSGQEPVETVELAAEVIWTGVPEEMTIPNTTLKLMSGENVVESIEVTDGSLEVKFTPVAKFNDVGEEILYSVSQDPLENFTTEIRDFVVENTYVEPVVVAEVVEEPVVEESVVEEPVVEEPVVEEPVVEEPVIEPKVEEPVEEPKLEELVLGLEIPEEELIGADMIDGEMDPSMIGKPVGPDGVILGAEMPYTPPGSAGNDLLPIAETFNRSMMSTQTSSLLPGEVIVDKYAKPVPGLVNTWDVTLRIEGKDDQKTSHIVLVIDRSGSMSGSKLDNAKIAAKNFVDALLVNPNTMIAVVSYSYGSGAYEATINSNFSTDANALKAAINTLSAGGGTNTQAGVRRAHQMLSASGTADYKHIVLLSDGVPTQSFVINNLDASKFESVNLIADTEYNGYVTEDNNIYYRTKSTLTDYNYNQTIGYGSAPYTRYDTYNYRYRYYSHGNSAIAQASIFKNNIVAGQTKTLWTIAYGLDGYGAEVLLDMASSANNARSATESDLTATMAQIAGSINSAAKSITVEDQIATGFEIPAASIGVYTKIPGSSTVNYDSSQRKLTWNVGDLVTPKPGDPTIKYAELTYRVHITDAILGVTPVNNTYPTNTYAKANYTNSSGQPVLNVPFPIPMVNPIFLTVEKILLDPNGVEITNSPQDFLINVKSDTVAGAYAYDRTFSVIPDSSITTTELRLADHYTISENAPNYDVTIEVYNHTTTSWVTTNDFTVIAPGISTDSGQQDILIRVTNQEKVVNVVANKIWEGGPTPRPTVWFMLYRQIGENGTAVPVPFNEIPGEDDIKQLVNGVTQVSWSGITQTNNLGQLYIFSVREVNSEGQPFTPAYYTKTENGLTVTNTYTLTTVVVSKVVTGNMGDKTKEFTFTVTLGQGAEFPELGTGYTINPNNPSEATFTLKHEEEVTLIVPIGATLTIVESDNAGYTVSINGIPVTVPELTVTVESEGTSIEFTNNSDVIIDAGVALDSQPYMLVLVLMGLGGVAGLIWKRKHLKFD